MTTPASLAEITKRLLKADTKGAAEVLANLDADELARWVEEEKLPMIERERRREERNASSAVLNDDPFES